LAALSLTNAHTVFTTLFINDINQGDGTCVRMPKDGSTSTAPIRPLTSTDMACGRDGLASVAFTCPAPAGSKLTFEFREYADASQPGALDPSHKGPCAVYLKQVDNITSSAADGDGWFKIWDSGYDEQTGKWCTEKLIADNGLLSVALSSTLPTGYFLVRPELLALQQADKGDPQFYVECAQLFIQGSTGPGTLDVPADKKVSIPGHVKADDKGLTFNIYNQPLALPYPVPGPAVYFPAAADAGAGQKQTQGVVPEACLLKNANWCGFEVASYSDEDGCWAASEACWQQGKTCYDSAPPTGSANCLVWEGKCKGIQDACAGKQFVGPPGKGVKLVGVEAGVPGPIPGVAGETAVGGAGATATASAAEMPTTSAVVGSSPVSSATAGAAPEPTDDSCPADIVSKDGVCGGDLGQTCLGSEFGACCSNYGRCGSTRLHCGCGCQSAFGQC
ncbi:hypothetical protein CONLIGDRAFT_560478, partial [Coniochaeta ligniaria NRRL 30616]